MKSRNLACGDLDDVSPLVDDLMQRVGNITPILPVALVTTLFANDPDDGFNMLQIKAGVLNLLNRLEALGHRAYIPREDYNYAVNVGVRMLVLRNILVETDVVLRARPEEKPIIQYYANSISHLFLQ